MSPLEKEKMSTNAKQLAADAWNAVKDPADPEYNSIHLSLDHRHKLYDVAASALKGEPAHEIAGLEAYEAEVRKRVKAQPVEGSVQELGDVDAVEKKTKKGGK
jgi:hypothetical protein